MAKATPLIRLGEWKKQPATYLEFLSGEMSGWMNLMYIASKYKDACMLRFVTSTDEIMQLTTEQLSRMQKLFRRPFFPGFVWHATFNEYGRPDEYILVTGWMSLKEVVQAIIQCGSRFVIIPLSLSRIDGIGHANVIIIDKTLKVVEKFDPEGWNSEDVLYSYYRLLELTEALESFTLALSRFSGTPYEYREPGSMCPIDLYPQRVLARQGFDSGLCYTFVYLYISIRLRNPDSSPSEILSELHRKYPGKELQSLVFRFQNRLLNFRYDTIKAIIEKVPKDLKDMNDPDVLIGPKESIDNLDDIVNKSLFEYEHLEGYTRHELLSKTMAYMPLLFLYTVAIERKDWKNVAKIDLFIPSNKWLQLYILDYFRHSLIVKGDAGKRVDLDDVDTDYFPRFKMFVNILQTLKPEEYWNYKMYGKITSGSTKVREA